MLGDKPPGAGVAISGGGIRSATFALGVFQAWAKAGALARIDYISTVSGGGYFGAFLGRLFERPWVRSVDDVEWILKGGPEPAPEGAEPELAAAGRNVVAWLRENGRYMSPRGSGDLLLLFGALYRNWISIQFLLALLGTAFFISIRLLDLRVDDVVLDRKWGPLAAIALLPFALSLPLTWAYWLAWPGWERYVPIAGAIGVGYGLLLWARTASGATIDPWLIHTMTALSFTASAAAVWIALAYVFHRENDLGELRNRLASQLKNVLLVTTVFAVLGLVDLAAGRIYHWVQNGTGIVAAGGTLIAALGAFARHIVVMVASSMKGERPGWVLSAGSYLLAIALVGGLLIGYSFISHGIAFGFASTEAPARTLLSWLAALVVLALVFGRSVSFVNQSSHSPIYSARLARAYLGASNPDRWFRSPPVATIEPVPSDDVTMAEYWNPTMERRRKGGPLHLLNVTVNETVDGRSQVQQQDRKGSSMCLGPAGISVGVHHHLVYAERDQSPEPGLHILDPEAPRPGYHVFEYASSRIKMAGGVVVPHARLFTGEQWRLSQWMAVSGAAFSTGMGFRTNFGLSILTGLLNVRLGQWWNSNVEVALRGAAAARGRLGARLFGNTLHAVLPMFYYLLSEYIARFPGVARKYWYLSDGGHFENLGAYELIRRGLPVIVIVDAEADPDYSFEGLSNLVRKARVDFGAHVEFGASLDQLRPQALDPQTGFFRCAEHVAHGTVTYADGTTGRLTYIKASLTGNEDADVIEYARSHGTFPHETTSDQFFDEPQWESYRRLGEHIGADIEIMGR